MQGHSLLNFGPFRLDAYNEQLWRGQEVIHLTTKALAVLCYLVEHRGQLVTKDDLCAAVWPGVVVSDAALVVCIRELRQALGDERRTPQFIETVHGRGYRFIALVEAPTAPVASSELRSSSWEEAATSQYSVGISPQEERKKAKDENGLESSIQGRESNEQSLSSRVQGLELEEQRPIVTGQTLEPKPSDSRLSEPGYQTLDTSPPTHSWLSKGVVLAVVFLIGTVLTALYLSRPIFRTQDSALDNQAPPALALPDKPSIIVLPFVNLSGDPSQEYFSDGVTAYIISSLSRLSNIFVISRTSAFTYKGKPTKLRDISREMGVQYVLEGSVRKTDDLLRITAELIDATTDHQLWAEQYDRPLKNLFMVQDEIVQKIVTTLKLQLTLQGQGFVLPKHTDNMEAYDAFLRGRESFVRYTKEATAQARQMWEKALALDPQYAEVYASLGLTYYLDWVWRWSADPRTLERAMELGQKARALDDSLSLAHSLLSYVYAQKQQYDQAITEGERAIALAPNNGDAYGRLADVLNYAGRPEEALRMVKQGIRLNPRPPSFYLVELGSAYCMTGQYAEAAAALKQCISQTPTHVNAYVALVSNYMQQWVSQQSQDSQTLAQALTAAQRAISLNDSHAGAHMSLGYVYLWQKQYDQAIAEMERAIAVDPNLANGYASLAYTLGSIGRAEDALPMIEQALRRKPWSAAGHLVNIGTAYDLAGQPEGAISSLKQYLTHYPNILGVHLTLAAAYSELGREVEAQAEAVEVLRLNPNFSLDVHKDRMPIKDPATLERHIAMLRKAGLK